MTASSAPRQGTLLLMPNTLDHGTGTDCALTELLPHNVLQRAAATQHWVVENAKAARAFLKRVDALVPLAAPLQQLDIRELPKARKGNTNDAVAPAVWEQLLEPTRHGQDVALLSDAGLPALADPGALLVAQAHRLGVRVLPLPGTTAIAMTVAASGLNGQSFAFVGYVPAQEPERSQRLRALEATSSQLGQTQVVIETPYRNAALMGALVAALKPHTQLCVACGLTLPDGWVRTQTVAQWQARLPVFGADQPAVFAWLA
jgi:16S rRNA (cytidine1402-2'-O)-methyltransferase